MPKNLENLQAANRRQLDRFKETARSLGCDEDKERFEAALSKIAGHKPETKPQKTKPKADKPAK